MPFGQPGPGRSWSLGACRVTGSHHVPGRVDRAGSYIARLARTTLLEVIHEDYVRTARAKGLSEKIVIMRHALQNAILPVITYSGVLLGILLGGSVVVERAFGVHGLGSTLILAYNERDFIVMQNLVFIYGLVFVVVNLLVDLSYGFLDPRIRYGK